MAAFQYKKTQTINLKAEGFIDIKNMTIEVDGEIKNISTLLSDFDASFVSLNIMYLLEFFNNFIYIITYC